MSYESQSKLPKGTSLSRAKEVIELLGYKLVADEFKTPDRIASYFWYDENEYKSYVGVELSLYKEKEGKLIVYTRSRVGRSYWDLTQQNKSLRLIRDLIGGSFKTDAGKNRYWRPEENPPTPVASGCFIGRWRMHNALGRAQIYLMNRKLEGDIAKDGLSPFSFMDEMNPRLLSNNLLIPYVIAVWEEYFRYTFTVLLQYSPQRTSVFKKVRINYTNLEKVATESHILERAIAESFYFQRPSAISEQFKLLNKDIDVAGVLRKPYRRRKKFLYDSIEDLVEGRSAFVHSGEMNTKLFDKELKTVLSDIEEATNRVYEHFAQVYEFKPRHDYQ